MGLRTTGILVTAADLAYGHSQGFWTDSVLSQEDTLAKDVSYILANTNIPTIKGPGNRCPSWDELPRIVSCGDTWRSFNHNTGKEDWMITYVDPVYGSADYQENYIYPGPKVEIGDQSGNVTIDYQVSGDSEQPVNTRLIIRNNAALIQDLNLTENSGTFTFPFTFNGDSILEIYYYNYSFRL